MHFLNRICTLFHLQQWAHVVRHALRSLVLSERDRERLQLLQNRNKWRDSWLFVMFYVTHTDMVIQYTREKRLSALHFDQSESVNLFYNFLTKCFTPSEMFNTHRCRNYHHHKPKITYKVFFWLTCNYLHSFVCSFVRFINVPFPRKPKKKITFLYLDQIKVIKFRRSKLQLHTQTIARTQQTENDDTTKKQWKENRRNHSEWP